MREKVVLAYSGGLDTSIIIPWLKENYDYDVIAFVADVGQGDDIDAVVEKAYKTGACKVIVEDLRQEFLTDYVFPAIQAGAVYEHKYLLGTSLARPIIAKYQVEIALREGATAVAHGCTGKGNDQVRFEHAYQALAPELKVIVPWREWTLQSREDCLDYAEAHGIPVAQSREKIHSRDRNLLHVSHEGGELEDPNNAPLPTTWTWTKSPQDAPDTVEKVTIEFKQGIAGRGERRAAGPGGDCRGPERDWRAQCHWPHRPGREPLRRHEVARLLRDAGRNAAADRASRARSAVPRPRPGALQAAHRTEVCRGRLLRPVVHAAARIAAGVRRQARRAIVNGTVTLALYKGNIDVAGRKSETSLYRPDIASFTMGASYNQKDAEGFIRILGLPARSRRRHRAPKMRRREEEAAVRGASRGGTK